VCLCVCVCVCVCVCLCVWCVCVWCVYLCVCVVCVCECVCVRVRVRVCVCVCVCVALVIQHAMHMRHIVSSPLTCMAVQYFYTLSQKRQGFCHKVIDFKPCFDFLYNFFLNVSYLRRTRRKIIIHIYRTLRKISVILISFQLNFIYLTDFWKILKYQISWKSVQWEPRCSVRADRHTERQTDERVVTNSSFSQFCERA